MNDKQQHDWMPFYKNAFYEYVETTIEVMKSDHFNIVAKEDKGKINVTLHINEFDSDFRIYPNWEAAYNWISVLYYGILIGKGDAK